MTQIAAEEPVANAGSRPTGTRYVVLAWFCLAAAIAYIQRNSIAVAEETIRTDLGLSLDQMGWAMASFFVAYGLLQIPAGWLAQFGGTRAMLAMYAAGWSVATALLALPGGFVQLLTLRFAGGAAQAGIFPCTTQSTARWFPATQRALASGFLGSFMSVGGAVGAALTGVLLGSWSWRWIFFGYAVPGLVWSVWFFRWFRERPGEHAAVNRAELELIQGLTPGAGGPPDDSHDSAVAEPTPWRSILGSSTMWWINAQHFFRGAGYIFYATWFATFLKETRGVSLEASGVLTSLPLLAVVLGSPIGGMTSDWVLTRTGSLRLARQGVAVGSTLGCATLIMLSYFVRDPWLAVLLISAGSFCASFSGPCAYAITIDVGGRHVAPVFSMMNMWGNIGAFVFPIMVPRLVRLTGNWESVLFLFAGVYFAAAVCWLFANPMRPVVERHRTGPPCG